MRTFPNRGRAIAWPLVAASILLASACASNPSPTEMAQARQKSSDTYTPFLSTQIDPPRQQAPQPQARNASPTGAASANVGSAPAAAVAASPPARPAAEGDPVVGQVEGSDLLASEVIGSMASDLADLGRTTTARQFRERARGRLSPAVRSAVIERLFLVDATRALNDRQRERIDEWKAAARERVVRDVGQGDPVAADRNLRTDRDQTLEDYVADLSDQAMIQWRLRSVIEDRVAVTDELIETEYRRRWDDFHFPERRTIRLIRTSDPDAAARIDEALAAGTSFEEVARWQENAAAPSPGRGAEPRVVDAGDLVEPLEAGVAALAPGGQTTRIGVGRSFNWVQLVNVQAAREVDLEAARPTIERELTQAQQERLRVEHIRQLLETGQYTPLDEILRRTVDWAVQRYSTGIG